MNLKLKSIRIENFQGQQSVYIANMENLVSISGENAIGKTTILNAFMWCLFDKDAEGNTKFNIRTLDADNNPVHNTVIKVELTFDDGSGKCIIIGKTQEEKWTKKRGDMDYVFSGNVNHYFINGYEYKLKDFTNYVDGIMSAAQWKLCSDPRYFPSLPWKEQRKTIMAFVPELDDIQLINEYAEEVEDAKDLIEEIENAPSLDDVKSKLTKAKNSLNATIKELPARIDELSRQIIDLDENEIRKKIQECDDAIAEHEKEIEELSAVKIDTEPVREEMYKVRAETNDRVRELDNAYHDYVDGLNKDISETDMRIKRNEFAVKRAEQNITFAKNTITAQEERYAMLEKKYYEEKKSEFSGTLDFDEKDWAFDESATICKCCGQVLPKDQIDALKKAHAEAHDKALISANERFRNASDRFAVDKEKRMKNINIDAAECKRTIADAKEYLKIYKKELADAKAEIEKDTKRIEEMKKALGVIKKPDFDTDEKCVELGKKRDELSKTLESLHEKIKENDAKISDIEVKIDAIKCDRERYIKELAFVDGNKKIEERIKALRQEQKDATNKQAKMLRLLDIFDAFVRFKMNKMEEPINSLFRSVKVKLFEEQINGGIAETFSITVNGVPYADVNNGHKIIAGLELIDVFGKKFGNRVPVWIDNAESVNDYNIPTMESQVICLNVSDNNPMKFEGCKGEHTRFRSDLMSAYMNKPTA